MFMSFVTKSPVFLRSLVITSTISLLAACGGGGNSDVADSGGNNPNESTNGNETTDGLVSVGLVVELTSGGKVEGQVNSYDGKEYLGIPYAKPPVGDLRFVAPVAKGTVGDSFSAKAFGDACIQPDGLGKPTNVSFSEDCLSLNVYIPETVNTNSALPIMVFIHGGSLVNGAGSEHDGGRLAQEQDVIVVTINYRLGALGFLSLAALDTEMSPEYSGNVGLMDQQLALKWVQENVANFGGNHNKVTVFGESAGSTSTCIHIVSPDSQDLAHQFILQSGICTRGDALLSNTEALTRSSWVVSTATGTNCSGGTDADELACLRGLDASDFAIKTQSGLGGWNAVVRPGSGVMPEDPKTTIDSATGFNMGPVILGFNKDEWDLFSSAQGLTDSYTEAAFNATIEATFPDGTESTDIKGHYGPGDDGQAALNAINDALTDYAFRCPTRNLTRQLENTNDVWLYSFDQGPAWHAFELPYVFGTDPIPNTGDLVESVRIAMQDAWGEFARTGSPGTAWTKYNSADDKRISFAGASPSMITDSQAQSDLCDFWDGISY